jgi:2-polyprenyl-3-methyl-5-hydroxy-6-metoxy-1,4-benzoquinol methylase
VDNKIAYRSLAFHSCNASKLSFIGRFNKQTRTAIMSNIWNLVPLEDYEKHMSHETVGQLQLLNELTKKYLESLRPETAMFLGVAGGNGLEHIDNRVTRKVYGIDINEKYLRETRMRFENRIADLQLINMDIGLNSDEIAKVDFIWAALIFEYVEMNDCFRFISNNIQHNGHVIITIQVNNGVSSVSKSGVETIKLVGPIFKVVNANELLATAGSFGFELIKKEENKLPNGKALETVCLRLATD